MQRAADHQARLETLMVNAGGIAGPGTIGQSYLATDEEVHA